MKTRIVLLMMTLAFSGLAQAEDDGLFEMRTYITNDGKLDALHDRFRNHTMAFFETHGMQNVAYWAPAEQPNTLIYVLEHASAEAAATNWKNFIADPAWQAVYAESIEDGALVKDIQSVFMKKTAFSP